MAGNSVFQRKTVWVTGASGGIGEALAKQLAGEGAQLILSARSADKLNALNAALGGGHRVLPLDLLDLKAVQAAVDGLRGDGAIPDMLINNAGISQRSLVLETDFEVYRQLMELDYFSVVYLTKALLPDLIAKQGTVVTISSVAGKMGTRLRSGYSAAKFALFGFMDALRAETYATGLKVIMVAPGMVATDVARNALTADGSSQGHDDSGIAAGIDVDQCAAAIVRGIASGKEDFMVASAREKFAVRLGRYWPAMLRKLMRNVRVT